MKEANVIEYRLSKKRILKRMIKTYLGNFLALILLFILGLFIGVLLNLDGTSMQILIPAVILILYAVIVVIPSLIRELRIVYIEKSNRPIIQIKGKQITYIRTNKNVVVFKKNDVEKIDRLVDHKGNIIDFIIRLKKIPVFDVRRTERWFTPRKSGILFNPFVIDIDFDLIDGDPNEICDAIIKALNK